LAIFLPKARIKLIRGWVEDDFLKHGDINLSSQKKGFPIKVGIPARIDGLKGHNVLLLACKKIIGIEIHVIGDGPKRGDVELFSEELGMTNVIYHGFLTDMMPAYEILDIVCLASEAEGGNPLVLLEAMALGKPVVASDIPAIKEFILDGVTGYLCPPGDFDAFSLRISELVNSADLRHKIGREGAAFIRGSYSAAIALTKYQELFSEISVEINS